MKLEEFKVSVKDDKAPSGIRDELKALWLEAKGDWDMAHRIVQVMDNWEACWVHAYLHRKEGDLSNAGYWYGRCKKKMPDGSFDEEWNQIAEALLASNE